MDELSYILGIFVIQNEEKTRHSSTTHANIKLREVDGVFISVDQNTFQ